MMLFEPDARQLDPQVKALLDEIRALDPHGMTPLEALTALDRLVRAAQSR